MDKQVELEQVNSQFAPDSSGVVEQLKALTTATLAVSSELDLDRVLQQISDSARQFAHAHYAAMGIVDEQGIITSFITSGISREEREKIGEPPRGHGLLGVLIKQGKALRVRDMTKDPRRSGFPPNHPPMTSLLGVPVSSKGRIVGDLYLTDKIGADEFSAEDEWWLTLFAQQAAVAVENAGLYRKVQIAHQRAQVLAELAGRLNQAIEVEALFSQITQAAGHLLELPAAALYLLDAGRRRFDLQAQIGLAQEDNDKPFLPLEGSIAGEVLRQGSPVIVSDTSILARTFFLPLASRQKPSSLLVVPIGQFGQISGVLEVYSAQPRQFSSEDVSLLEAFAGYAALALEKAQAYRHKQEFLSMVVHDLRAPLTAIKMSAGLLEASLPADLPPALNTLASNISRNGERLNTLLTDLLDLTRLEQGQVQLDLQSIELVELVETLTNNVLPLFKAKNQTLTFAKPSRPCMVEADRRRIEQVITNLLTNANKYTPENNTVAVSLQINNNWVTVLVKDSGPGIPAAEQERIFDRYYRRAMHEHGNQTSPRAEGTGLGLAIARYLVDLHGGRIWVESQPGQGSTFFVKLPLAKLL